MGAGENHYSPRATFQGILIVFIAWPLIVLLKPYLFLLFGWLKTPESQIAFHIEYISILAWGVVFTLLRHTVSCYFVGIGRTKIVMQATVVAMITNVVLDYILILVNSVFNPWELRELL